jgi:hypothetical protein
MEPQIVLPGTRMVSPMGTAKEILSLRVFQGVEEM